MAEGPTPAARGELPGGMQRLLRMLTSSVTISVVLAFVIGGLIIAAGGTNPLRAYPSLFSGSLTGQGLVDTFGRAIPIVGMAIAVGFAFRAGVFNLGAEGQMVLGALAGAVVALKLPGPGPVVMVVAVLAAVAAAGLWAVLCAVMETGLGVPILISSLLLNFPARYFASYLVRFPLKDRASSMVATKQVPAGTRIDALVPASSRFGGWLSERLGNANVVVLFTRRITWSLFVLVVLVVAVIVFNNRTASGYESGMAGLNARFARYGGVRTGWMRVWVMFASGGIAGLIGIMLVLGGTSQYRLIDGALVGTNYAWTGLLVALLAGSRPLSTAVAGFFFAVLVVGGEAMQRSAGVASQIAQVVQALVIILVVFRVSVPRRGSTPAVPATPVVDRGRPEAEPGRI